MDKTININLGGTLFQIDEEAYGILRNYLQSIDLKFRNTSGGNETIEDIELRIAEIFQSQKGVDGIITKVNVEAMISVIGKPEDFGHTENESAAPGYTTSQSRKMFRNPDNTIIGGVCGGIGTYLGTDPVWIRILFVVFTFFFGVGLFVYLALWIALPSADTDNRKKDMYGSNYSRAVSEGKSPASAYQTTSKAGNAVNEVFRAIGKFCFIIVRVFLILIGTSLVLTGFLALFTFILVFIFKYPGAFSTDITGINLSYFPDILNYIVTPALVPWIKALIIFVVSLPLLALIYGGIRMIFWFRARDGFLWLAGLVLWVLSAAALSIMLFNEGVGFAENGRTTSREYFSVAPDTLYLKSGMKIQDLKVDKEITIPNEEYDAFYISDEKNEIYFRTSLDIEPDEGNAASYEVIKRSAGRSRLDAQKKCDRLLYNSHISNKTIYLDEFFTIPSGSKWSFDFVSVKVHAPEGTIISMDKTVERLFRSYSDDDYATDTDKRLWRMTENGPEHIEPSPEISK
jgi:phage shock protein PspC (stress-responsive transcriptional regulator)